MNRCSVAAIGGSLQIGVHHPRVTDWAWADGVDSNAVLRVAQSQAFRQSDECHFADRIDGIVSSWEQAGVAGRVHDAAAAGANQVRDRKLGSEKRGFEIRVETIVPVGLGNFLDLLDHADAGVVDQDVQAAGSCRGAVDQLLQFGDITGVTG